jgi:hypothetical protein
LSASPFLKIGTTFAILILGGTIPFIKEQFMIAVSGLAIK